MLLRCRCSCRPGSSTRSTALTAIRRWNVIKVIDEDAWVAQKAELEVDEVGRTFRRFVEAWAEDAERWLESDEKVDPAEAIRLTLAPIEEAQNIRLSSHFMGQMLVCIAIHWVHGKEMMEAMSAIESRLVQDMLVLKMASLEAEAAEEGVVEGEVVGE